MQRVAAGLLAVSLAAAGGAPALAQPLPAAGPGPAGRPAAGAGAAVDPGLIDGPPAPAAPAVLNRDAAGRATVRAIRLDEGLRLDEPVYAAAPPIDGFIQHVPDVGAPATEAWITFDDENVYVSARLWDSAPRSRWVANEMRRDTAQLRENDNFGAFFDTFYDRRNGFMFYANPLGGRADQQFTNEGNPNADWNPVWDVRTGRFDGGWTIEMRIPFKTFRYRSEPPHVWGVQLRRGVRRKNEYSYLTRLPLSAGGGSGSTGIFRVSAAGSLVGLKPPPANSNVEIKPYGVDGTFAFFENLNVITYLARTRVPGPDHRGRDLSYQGTVDYAADRYGLKLDHLVVEDNFLPEVGFLRRGNFRRSYASGRFSPRPRALERVRQFSLEGSVDLHPSPATGFRSPRRTTTSCWRGRSRRAARASRSRPGATASPTRGSPTSSGSSGASTGWRRCGGAPTSTAA